MGYLGMVMANSRRRVRAEGERVRIATLYFDIADGAESEGDIVSTFEAKHPYMNVLIIHHETGIVNGLPLAAEVEPIRVVQGLLRIQNRPTRTGDVSFDYSLDLTDAIALLDHLFRGGPQVPCPGASDINGDHVVDVGDLITLLNHLFLGSSLEESEVHCDGRSPRGETADQGGEGEKTGRGSGSVSGSG